MQNLIKFLKFAMISVGVFGFNYFFSYYYAKNESLTKDNIPRLNLKSDDYVNEVHRLGFMDDRAFSWYAQTLINDGKLLDVEGNPSAFYVPGYAVVLAIGFWLFEPSAMTIFLVNSFLIVLTFWVVCLIADRWFSRSTVIVSAALFLVNIKIPYHAAYAYSENLFNFGLILLFYFCGRALLDTGKTVKSFICASLVLGVLVLVRPAAMPLFFVFTFFLFYKLRSQWWLVLSLCILMTMPVGLWILRNKRIYNEFLMTTAAPIAFFDGNHDGLRHVDFFDHYGRKRYDLEWSSQYTEILKRGSNQYGDIPYKELREYKIMSNYTALWRKENRLLYLKLCAWRFKSVFMPFTVDMSIRNQVISTVLWLLIFLPAMIGLFLFSYDLRFWSPMALAIPLMVLPAMVVLDSYLRYQLPVQILLTPVAAMVWVRIGNYLKNLLKSTS